MVQVKIYSTQFCPYCRAAKTFFTDKEIEFEEIDLTNSLEKLIELKNKTQFSTVPQIFIKDKFIGGYQELLALETKGELDKYF